MDIYCVTATVNILMSKSLINLLEIQIETVKEIRLPIVSF